MIYNKMSIQNSIFIVVGRLGKNLILSKVLPVISSGLFTNIYVFSEDKGYDVNGIKYIILPSFIKKLKPIILKKVIRIIYEPLQLIYYTWRIKPEIIHGYYTIPKGFNSMVAAKLGKTKCIISVIGGKEEIETAFVIKRFSRSLIIWLLKRADFITTKGEKDNEYLMKQGIKKDNICVFNGSIDVSRFHYHNEIKDIDLIFAGYFDKYKGPQRAIRIIADVIHELPHVKACFIGEGPLLPNIKQEAMNLDISNNVIFAGYVHDPEKYYGRSKVLLFPSSNEGLSTAMLEAMACRCVPITSDVGNQKEVAWNGKNAIVIADYNNIADFSKNAIKLLKDPVLLNNLAEDAEKTILNKYTSEIQGKICSSFYSQLMSV